MVPQATVRVVLRNDNSTLSTNEFEIFDMVHDASLGTFTLKGGESRTITIAQGDDGKGKLRIRNPDLGPNDWVEISVIGPGDVITG